MADAPGFACPNCGADVFTPPKAIGHDPYPTVLVVEGTACVHDFDKSYYTDDHDVPAVWIGNQVVALGNGCEFWPGDTHDENHLFWKLDDDKWYRLTIEEIPPPRASTLNPE